MSGDLRPVSDRADRRRRRSRADRARTRRRRPAAFGRHAAGGRHPQPGRARRDGRGARPVLGARHAAPTPRVAHRLSISSRCRRGRRSRPGRVRQGVQSHHLVSGSLAIRGLVHTHSHQRLPGSAEGAIAARPLDRRAPKSRARTRPASRLPGPGDDPEHRLLARERRARIASAIDRLDGRQRTVFMLFALRRLHAARDQRDDRPEANRPFASTCSAPHASCAACSEARS